MTTVAELPREIVLMIFRLRHQLIREDAATTLQAYARAMMQYVWLETRANHRLFVRGNVPVRTVLRLRRADAEKLMERRRRFTAWGRDNQFSAGLGI